MDIHSILVEYFIDDPNDLTGYMNDAYSLIAGECIKKELEFNGYFRTKYEEALKNLTDFDEDYFNDENRIKLYVLLSSLQNKEIMSHLQDIYTISQQIQPSEDQVIEMINELLDRGVEF